MYDCFGRKMTLNLHESAEMYIETIYRLSRENAFVRSVDVADAMGYSKPSVSRAMALLRQGGYLLMDHHGRLTLTDEGKSVAEKIYERHNVLSSMLISLGVDAETAAEDACRIEHVISDSTFAAIKRHIEMYKPKTED